MTPKTWDEVVALLKRRGLDAEAFWCAYDVLSENGLAVVPREATPDMRVAGLIALSDATKWLTDPAFKVCKFPPPFSSKDTDPVWSAALSAGELAPPDKGE